MLLFGMGMEFKKKNVCSIASQLQGNAVGYHYRGLVLRIECFRSFSLSVYQWPNG